MIDAPSILPLHVDRLTYVKEGRALVDRVSFEIGKGGIVVVIGPNGAGKSLTLRLCHGLLEPTSGAVLWQTDVRSPRRHGMVFQRPVMLRRSVEANVAHAIRAQGGKRTAREALHRFGLSELAKRPARLLSGGEQQRLAMARAWALEPEVLFLDEPTSQLDPGATRQIEATIRSLAEEGVTILMTTHDLGQARRLANRVLFFHRGQLLDDAPANVFFGDHGSPQSRAFIAGDLIW